MVYPDIQVDIWKNEVQKPVHNWSASPSMVWDGLVGFACGNWLALALHKWWIYFSWWFSFGWLVFSVFQPPNMGFIVDLAAKMRVLQAVFSVPFCNDRGVIWSNYQVVIPWEGPWNHAAVFEQKPHENHVYFSELNPMEIILCPCSITEKHHWLVVWLPWIIFSQKYWVSIIIPIDEL